MKQRRLLVLFEVGVVFSVAALVAASALGQPILLGYVETGSMEPTLSAGDGFIAVPAVGSPQVEEGDVVVFEAEYVQGGGLVTHRVVEETDRGYVTRGDANTVTDQDAGEPHVTDGQILATALRFDGEVVAIPGLGTGAMAIETGVEWTQHRLAALLGTQTVLGTRGLGYILMAFAAVLFGRELASNRRTADRSRSRSRSRSREGVYDGRHVVGSVFLIVIAVALVTTFLVSGTHEVGIVSAEFESESTNVVPAGETVERTVEIGNGGLLPQVVVVEPTSEGVQTDPGAKHLGPGETTEVTAAITAPPETGYYVRGVAEYRYFAVLPTEVILTLHAIHPWLATLATAGVIGVGIAAPVALALGIGMIRTRERGGTIFGGKNR